MWLRLVELATRFKELLTFSGIYIVLALINLRVKLLLTRNFFNGKLAQNHESLLDFNYTNNEQSRLLQFYIPEFFENLFQIPIAQAYLLQRWLFTFLALILFHLYLRRWFKSSMAFAATVLFALVMNLTFFNHLQESSPLLLVTFLLGLWAIREKKDLWFASVLLIGASNNETVLILPFVYFLFHWKSWLPKDLMALSARTCLVALPAFTYMGVLRYLTRDRPHLGGHYHLPNNIKGVWTQLLNNPLDYWKSVYLYPIMLFGVLWVFAYIGSAVKPVFLRRALWMAPVFVLIHLVTGVIYEARQMLPLAFIVIPASFYYCFSEELR